MNALPLKTFLRIWVLALLFAAVPNDCLALRSFSILTTREAKELGIEIRVGPSGPEAAWLELEFKPEGKLKDFNYVELQINEGEKPVIAYARLKETRTSSGSVVVRMMVNRAFLEKITLEVALGEGGAGVGGSYRIPVKDFVDVTKIR